MNMHCRKCDYLLQPFDKECPRCQGGGLPEQQVKRIHSISDFGTYALLIWFFASIIFLIVECDPLDNTLGGRNLAFISAAIGIIVSVILTALLYRFNIKSADFSPLVWWFGFFALVCTMTSVSVASSLNRNLSSLQRYHGQFKVTRKGVSSTKSRSYYLHFKSSYGNERVVVSRKLYQSAPVGSTLIFSLRPGFFGYPVVTKIV